MTWYVAILSLVSFFMHTMIFMIFWNWWIAPLFVPISVGTALGLYFMLEFVFRSINCPDPRKYDTWTELLTPNIFLPLAFLTMGWIIHLFVH